LLRNPRPREPAPIPSPGRAITAVADRLWWIAQVDPFQRRADGGPVAAIGSVDGGEQRGDLGDGDDGVCPLACPGPVAEGGGPIGLAPYFGQKDLAHGVFQVAFERALAVVMGKVRADEAGRVLAVEAVAVLDLSDGGDVVRGAGATGRRAKIGPRDAARPKQWRGDDEQEEGEEDRSEFHRGSLTSGGPGQRHRVSMVKLIRFFFLKPMNSSS